MLERILNLLGIPFSLCGVAGWVVAWDCLHSHCRLNHYLSRKNIQIKITFTV